MINLIALGLERFSGEFAPIHKIQIHLLPCKKVTQIQIRVKNLRSARSPIDNPVKYYYTHRKAPPMPRNVQIFDPSEVKAPKDLKPSDDLPDWIIPFFSKRQHKPKFIQFDQNHKKTMGTVPKPLFILPKGIVIQNHSILHPVIPQQFDVTSNTKDNIRIAKCSVKKVIKRNFMFNKPPLILTKDIVRNDKEFYFDVGDEIHDANDTGKMQDITINKPLGMLENGLDNKCDKISITSDVDIKTEVIEELCDSSQNASFSDYDTEKIPSSSLLNGHNNEQNSNFVKSEIQNKDVEIPASVFEITKLVQPHHIKQEIKDDFEIAQTCENAPDENSNKNVFLKNTSKNSNDKQDINISKHTLINKRVSESVDYIPDPNDKEGGIVIKSEIIEESNDSLTDTYKSDSDLEETLLVDSRSATNGYNHSLQKRNLKLENLPTNIKKRRILHDNFHTLTNFPKSVQNGEQHDSYPMQNFKSNNIQNHSILHHVIPQELDVTSNTKIIIRNPKRKVKKVIKRNLIKSQTLYDHFNTLTDFPKSVQKGEQHDSYAIQNFKSNNKIVDPTIIANMTGYSEAISIKSEIIDYSEASLQNHSDTLFDKPVLKTTKHFIKSNSLEKAHVKEHIRILKQKKRKQKCKTKRKVRKKN